MGRYWRKVKSAVWNDDPLIEGRVKADAIADLKTKGNTLSVFLVNDDADIPRINAAFAGTMQSVDSLDYVILDSDNFLGLPLEQKNAKTADAHVNTLHHDLVRLTGENLVALASYIVTLGSEMESLAKGEVEDAIVEAGKAASFDVDKCSINKEERNKLKTRISSPES